MKLTCRNSKMVRSNPSKTLKNFCSWLTITNLTLPRKVRNSEQLWKNWRKTLKRKLNKRKQKQKQERTRTTRSYWKNLRTNLNRIWRSSWLTRIIRTKSKSISRQLRLKSRHWSRQSKNRAARKRKILKMNLKSGRKCWRSLRVKLLNSQSGLSYWSSVLLLLWLVFSFTSSSLNRVLLNTTWREWIASSSAVTKKMDCETNQLL